MTAAEGKLWKTLRSGSPFVAFNVLAGLLHYLFQVLASQRLTSAEFSDLNSWFAHIALFFVVGGVLQYAANFFPSPRHRLRTAILGINALSFALTVLWPYSPEGQTVLRALMILTGCSLFGWLMGQLQIRMLFNALTISNLLVALTKLTLIYTPISGPTELDRFTFALFACYLPALWYASVAAWKSHDQFAEGRKKMWSLELWSAPVVLSAAAAIIPQMDLVLMSWLQPPVVFQEFARASLFYKGIYFFIFIFAQWLLPFQIRKHESGLVKASLALAAAAVFGSAALTGAAPWIVRWLLHWDQTPSLWLIFASCLNMSLLTWAFLLIQESCAQGRTRLAAVALAILAAEGGIQIALGLDALYYLGLAIGAQAAIVFILSGNAALKTRIAVNISR